MWCRADGVDGGVEGVSAWEVCLPNGGVFLG